MESLVSQRAYLKCNTANHQLNVDGDSVRSAVDVGLVGDKIASPVHPLAKV